MTKRTRADRAAGQADAIARDIAATIARLTRDDDLDTEDRSGDEIVTDFIDSVRLDDRTVENLWSQQPLNDIDEGQLVALAQHVAGSAAAPPAKEKRDGALGTAEEASEGGRVGRRLRAPRHPFE